MEVLMWRGGILMFARKDGVTYMTGMDENGAAE
jgi:hypothetical protein